MSTASVSLQDVQTDGTTFSVGTAAVSLSDSSVTTLTTVGMTVMRHPDTAVGSSPCYNPYQISLKKIKNKMWVYHSNILDLSFFKLILIHVVKKIKIICVLEIRI